MPQGEEFAVPVEDELLLIPGPTPVPRRVRSAAARPLINHRGPKFVQLYQEVIGGLRPLFGLTEPQGTILVFPGSGTGAMESAVANLFSPGERVAVGVMGEFGHRFAQIAQAFGLEALELHVPWGTAITPTQLESFLHAHSTPPLAAVILTQNETSTGVTANLAQLAPVVHRFGLPLIVDAVSALAGIPMQMEEWGVDVVVTASQKALMCPPGLAIVGVRQSIWHRVESARLPRYYWDYRQSRKFGERGETPYTPAVSLWYALQAGLTQIHAQGLEQVYASHRQRAAMVRTGLRAIGLQPLVTDEAIASPTVTAVRVPEGVDASKILKRLREEQHVVAAGGQGELKGKIWRFAHMGAVGIPEVEQGLAAFEQVLRDEGICQAPAGTAVAAARQQPA